jgi:ABC-type transport system substrate-binding protein
MDRIPLGNYATAAMSTIRSWRPWLKAQRQTKDLAARKHLIFDIQRHAAEQQYYIYLASLIITSSWQPYMKNYAHNLTFDYGSRIAVTWLDR